MMRNKEDAKRKKFNTPYNRAQIIDWCEGEAP